MKRAAMFLSTMMTGILIEVAHRLGVSFVKVRQQGKAATKAQVAH